MAMVSDSLLKRLFFFRLVTPNLFHGHLNDRDVAFHNTALCNCEYFSTITRPILATDSALRLATAGASIARELKAALESEDGLSR